MCHLFVVFCICFDQQKKNRSELWSSGNIVAINLVNNESLVILSICWRRFDLLNALNIR